MTLSNLFAHDWKTRLSRMPALVSVALFAAALTYGVFHGRAQRDSRLEGIAAHRADVSSAMATWFRDLQALERGASGAPPWAGSAMDVTFATDLPPAPLGDFAVGQSDLLPQFGAVSLWNPDIRLFSRYELGDPVSLALGAFDLAIAILLLLPLLLIVLSYDVLSSERDANRLDLLLAQGADLRALLWGRLLLRGGAAIAPAFLVSLAALVIPGGAASLWERLPWFVLWVLGVLVYALFWVAIIGFLAVRNRRGETTVMVLLLTWAAFLLLVPAVVAAVAEAVYPPPSRLSYLAQARAIEIRTERAEPDIARGFALDHPDMVVDEASQMPAYVRTAFFVTSAVDDATRPLQAEFDRASARRDRALGFLGHLSPTIVLHALLNDIAGTSAARHRRYAAAARALKAEFARRVGPAVVAGRRLAPEDVAPFTDFRLEEEPPGAVLRRHAGSLFLLALAAALLLLAADRRVRRIRGPAD